MKTILWGLLLYSLVGMAAPLPVSDQDFPCTTQEKADSYVIDFNIDLKTFGGMELCDSSVDTKKFFNDLSLIEDGRFQGTDDNVFIQNKVDRDQYLSYLKKRTRGVRRGNEDPTATAYNSGGYFTMQLGWTKLSTLGRVGVVIHEARHTEGYGHRSCSHGPYSNSFSSGCDDSVPEGGAHGVEMEYYSRVALQGVNFHPAYQSMARLMNIARANFVFNKNPMSQVETLVALTDNKLVQWRNGQRFELPLSQSPAGSSQLKRTSAGVSLVNEDLSVMALDLTNSQPSAEVVDAYSYFKLLMTNVPVSLSLIADLEEFDIGNLRLFFLADTQGQIYSYLFAKGTWARGKASFQNFSRFATRAPDGKAGIFAVMTTNQYCALDLTDLDCSSALQAWPADADNFVQTESQLLELNNSQVVDAKSRRPFVGLQGEAVQAIVEAPSYNVFELQQ